MAKISEVFEKSKSLDDNKIVSFRILSSNYYVEMSRSYMKLIDVGANIGGNCF